MNKRLLLPSARYKRASQSSSLQTRTRFKTRFNFLFVAKQLSRFTSLRCGLSTTIGAMLPASFPRINFSQFEHFLISNSKFIIKNTSYLKKLALFILILFSLQIKTSAQPVKVTAALEDSIYLIGQHIPLNLTLERDANIEVTWPFLVDSLGSFEILKSGKIDTTLTGNTSLEQQQIFITKFDTGYHVLPPIEFTYRERNRKETAKTEPFLLRINTLEVDTTAAIMPIKNVIGMPLTFKEKLKRALIIVGIVLAVLAIPLGIYFYFKRRKKEAYVPPPLPPYELAIKKLQALKAKKLWQEGDIKNYYSELTGIFREYVEGRFELPALEMTTDELSPFLKKKKEVTKGLFRNMVDLLSISDFVKFAKARPSTKYHADAFDQVKDFVRQTKPIEVESGDLREARATDNYKQNVASAQKFDNSSVPISATSRGVVVAESPALESVDYKKDSKRILIGIMAILFGFLGVHKFMLGYTKQGIIQIVISIVTCGFGGAIMGLIEGIIYLTKTDEEFYETYRLNQKKWF